MSYISTFFTWKCMISLRWCHNKTPDTYIIMNLIINLMFPINCFYLQKTKVEEMGEMGEMGEMEKRRQLLWEEQLLWFLLSFFSCSSGLGQRKKMTELKLVQLDLFVRPDFRQLWFGRGCLNWSNWIFFFDPIADIYYI